MTTEQTNRPGGVTAVLARRIPGAAYRVIAGAGHLTSMEQPAAVSDLLARFVTELDR